MNNRVDDWSKYPYDDDDDYVKPTPSSKRKEKLSRSDKFIIGKLKKKRGKKTRSGVVSAFGLNKGRIRY